MKSDLSERGSGSTMSGGIISRWDSLPSDSVWATSAGDKYHSTMNLNNLTSTCEDRDGEEKRIGGRDVEKRDKGNKYRNEEKKENGVEKGLESEKKEIRQEIRDEMGKEVEKEVELIHLSQWDLAAYSAGEFRRRSFTRENIGDHHDLDEISKNKFYAFWKSRFQSGSGGDLYQKYNDSNERNRDKSTRNKKSKNHIHGKNYNFKHSSNIENNKNNDDYHDDYDDDEDDGNSNSVENNENDEEDNFHLQAMMKSGKIPEKKIRNNGLSLDSVIMTRKAFSEIAKTVIGFPKTVISAVFVPVSAVSSFISSSFLPSSTSTRRLFNRPPPISPSPYSSLPSPQPSSFPSLSRFHSQFLPSSPFPTSFPSFFPSSPTPFSPASFMALTTSFFPTLQNKNTNNKNKFNRNSYINEDSKNNENFENTKNKNKIHTKTINENATENQNQNQDEISDNKSRKYSVLGHFLSISKDFQKSEEKDEEMKSTNLFYPQIPELGPGSQTPLSGCIIPIERNVSRERGEELGEEGSDMLAAYSENKYEENNENNQKNENNKNNSHDNNSYSNSNNGM